ncbi:MAG: RluA family pseudouridine synthase [Bradymonadaceae bacterium]|nr:RluA family pseudouridine synthase [Lujinxingiaceae bacterium]
MQPTEFSFIVDPEDEHTRLDVYLAEQEDPPLTRSQVRKCLDRGDILVNGQLVKSGYNLRADDLIVWAYQPPREPSLEAQNIPIDFLFEDEHLAIVDKPAGLVVHPSPGHPDATLVNALLYHFGGLASVGGELRPGIVHRIDKDTSGALVVSKTDRAHHHLAEQFRAHTIERIYHALVFGPGLPDAGRFDTLHGRDPHERKRFSPNVPTGRRAVTHYEVLERFYSGASLVKCWLETGRTHQIRMHFMHANAPLLGDALYGGPRTAQSPLITRQALHAFVIGFEHLDGTRIRREAPYPPDFAHALEALRAGKDWRP